MVGQRIAYGRWTLLLALAGCDRVETPASTTSAASVATPSASAAPTLDASIVPDVSLVADAQSATEASAPVDAAPEVAPAPPAVRVANIGMHIGGGPNDDVTKTPIAKSVAPHFDELRVCYALLETPMKVEVGVDLLIEAAGGKAKVTNPRSTAPGTALRDCCVRVFESIDFLPPKTGKTIVSYSVQFTPQKP
jgi:hypothetical protein